MPREAVVAVAVVKEAIDPKVNAEVVEIVPSTNAVRMENALKVENAVRVKNAVVVESAVRVKNAVVVNAVRVMNAVVAEVANAAVAEVVIVVVTEEALDLELLSLKVKTVQLSSVLNAVVKEADIKVNLVKMRIPMIVKTELVAADAATRSQAMVVVAGVTKSPALRTATPLPQKAKSSVNQDPKEGKESQEKNGIESQEKNSRRYPLLKKRKLASLSMTTWLLNRLSQQV